MAIELASLAIEQLKNLIDNHRRKGATDSAAYLGALSELERRKRKGLDFDKSLSIIAAAKQGRFLSYKELADASGADWGQVRYAVGGHLWNLVEYSHRHYGVLLSSIA
jgi:hypothetical protein